MTASTARSSTLEPLELLESAVEAGLPEPSALHQLLEQAASVPEAVFDHDEVQSVRARLLSVLDSVLERLAADAVRGSLLERRARLLFHVGDAEEAARVLAEAFRACPSDDTLSALAERAEPDAARERGYLELAAPLAASPERRAALEGRRGALALQANEPAKARAAFERALAAGSEDPVVRAGLDAVTELERQAELSAMDLRAAADAATPGAERARALLALYGESQDVAHLREAFHEDPGAPELAAELLQVAPDRAVAQSHLAAARSSRVAAARLCGLALIHTEEAFAAELLREALVADPADPEAIDALEGSMSAAGDTAGARALLQAARRSTKSRNDEKRWLIREGEITWRLAGDLDEAEKLFRRVRATDPRDMTAIGFFEAYFAEKADFRRLHAVLAQKLAIVPREDRVAVALEMARLAESHLESPDMAVEAFKRVLTEDATNEVATARLTELYRAMGKWHALVEILNGQIRRLGDGVEETEQKVQYLFQIIDIYQDPQKLPVDELVVQTYGRIVQLSPTNTKALDTLAQRYEDAARWSELVQVLQKKIAATTDEDTLLDLFHQVANLYLSKMSSDSQAVPFLERILEIDPQNLEVVQKLRDIYKAKHNLERLYAAYTSELGLTEPARREPILAELAALATDKLHWNDEAIRHWEALLELNPKNERAAQALLTLFESEGYWEKLCAHLGTRLEHSKTKRRRAELLEKQAEVLWERLQRGAEAKDAWREVLEAVPGHAPARIGLQRILVAEKAWEELKAFYAAQGDYRGYVAFLDEQAGRETDAQLRLEVQLECVSVVDGPLADAAGATERLSRLFVLYPARLDIATRLAERYEAAGEVDRLLPVLRRVADLAGATEEAESALMRGARALGARRREDEAFKWARQAAEVELDRSAARIGIGPLTSGLERWAEACDDFETLAAWYGEVEGRVGAGSGTAASGARIELLRRSAEIWLHRLRRPRDAARALEAILDLDENAVATIGELEELTYSEQDWPAYERVLRRRIDVLETEGDVDRLRLALIRLGRLHEEILEQPELAAEAYQRILARIPGDDEAVDGLQRVYEAESRWADLVGLVDAERALTGDRAKRAALDARAARILADRSGDLDAALDRLERSLSDHPDNDAAVLQLWELFEADRAREGVTSLIEPVLRRQGDAARLALVLNDRLGREADVGTLESLHDELAGLAVDPAVAFMHRLQQVALSPGEPKPRAQLEALAGQLGRWAEVAALYSAVLGLDDGPSGRDRLAAVDRVARLDDDAGAEAVLTRRLAELTEAQLGDLERATHCYERVLALDPEDLETLGALERLHAQRQDWESLLAVYRRKADLVWEVEDKRAVYTATANLLEDELERAEDAIEVYQSLLLLDERDAEAMDRLEGLFQRFERWDDLVALLRRRLPTSDDRVSVYVRIGRVLADYLGQNELAVDAWIAAIGDERGAAAQAAAEALDRLVAVEEQPELARRVADVLQPWYRAAGDWRGEVRMLTVRADLADSDRDRAGYFRQAGDRFEHQGGDWVGAFESYADALRHYPDEREAESGLQRAANALGRHADLADVLAEVSPYATSNASVRQLLMLADVARRELRDSDRALDALERVLLVEPDHVGALEQLDALYADTGRLRDRVAIVERRAERADGEVSRRRLLLLAGQLYEELGDGGPAADAYERVVRSGDPVTEEAVSEALDRLIGVYETEATYEPLVKALARKADVLGVRGVDAVERVAVLFRAAEVSEVELGDEAGATLFYERVRLSVPEEPTAFQNLRRLYGILERWDDLEALLLDARTRAEEDRTATITDYMLAQLYENQLARPSDALDRYEAILSRDPSFAAARRALEAALDSIESGPRAAELLDRAYVGAGDVLGQVKILELRLARWPDDDAVGGRLRLARLLEEGLGDPGRAFAVLGEAAGIEWRATGTLRTELVRLAGLTGAFDDLEILDREALARARGDEARLKILLEMGRVAREDRNDLDVAEGILRETLSSFPDHRETLEAMRSLYEATGRTREVIDTLRHEVERTAAASDRIALLYRIATLLFEREHDAAGAADTYEEILRNDPAEARAYRALESLRFADNDFPAVAALLRREIAVTRDAEHRLGLRQRLAVLCREQLGDPEQAFAATVALLGEAPTDPVGRSVLEQLSAEDPTDEVVFERLGKLYRDARDFETLIGLHRQRVEAMPGELLKGLDAIRTLQLTELQDRAAAYETEKAMLRKAPTEPRRWEQAEDSAGRLGLLVDLIGVYGQIVKDDPSNVDLALRAARLAEERLKRPSDAVVFYESVSAFDESHDGAAQALRRLYEQLERWRELADLEERLAVRASGRERERAWLAVAALRERLDDAEGAARALESLVTVEPGHRQALARLEALARQRGVSEDVESVLHRLLAVSHDDEAREVRYRLALLRLEGGDPAGALDFLREVLAGLTTGHSLRGKAIASTEEVLKEDHAPALRGLAADLLERAYAGDSKVSWHRWEAVYLAQLGVCEDHEHRMLLQQELGQLYEERAGEPQRALTAFAAAYALEPGNTAIEQTLEGVAGRHGLEAALYGVYSEHVESMPSEARVRVLARLAALAEGALSDADAAARWREQRLELVPGDVSALAALEQHYQSRGDHAAVLRVLTARLDVAETEADRIALLHRLGDLSASLNDVAAAERRWTEIRELAPGDRRALDRLEASTRARGAHSELAAVLRQKIDLAQEDDEDRLDWLTDLARLQERELGQLEDAARTYEESLVFSPQNILALTSLERLYPQISDHRGHLRILEAKRGQFADPRAKAEADLQIARLLIDELDEPDRALDLLRLILGQFPTHEGAVGVLESLLEDPRVALMASFALEPVYLTAERWKPLERAMELQLEIRARDGMDGAERIELLRRLAEIRNNELDDPDGALRALGEAFALDPSDEALRENLEEVAGGAGRWTVLVDSVRDALGAVSSPELAMALHAWIARLSEAHLDDPSGAIDAWRAVLAYDELEPTALSELGRLLEATGRFEERVDVLRREIAIAPHSESRHLRRRLAEITDTEVQNPEAAFQLYVELVAEDAEDEECVMALDLLGQAHDWLRDSAARMLLPHYRSKGQWNDVVRWLLAGVDDAPDRVERLEAAAAVAEQHLGDADAAWGYLKLAVLAAPERIELLQRLTAISGLSEGTISRAEELLALTVQAAGKATALETRRELLLRAAQLAGSTLGKRDVAERCYREVLVVDSENTEALQALLALYAAEDRPADLVGVAEALFALVVDREERLELARTMARAGGRVGDADRVEDGWRRVLELDDGDEEALQALEAHYRAAESYTALAEILERRARRVEDPDVLARLKVELGRIRGELLADPDGAIEAYEEAIEADGWCEPALLALELLYTEHAMPEDLARILGTRLQALNGAARIPVLARLATIAEEDLGDLELAVSRFEEMLVLDAGEVGALDALIRVSEAQGRFDRLALLLEQRAAVSRDVAHRIGLLVRAAQLWENPLSDLARSREVAESAHALDPNNRVTLGLLAQLFERTGELDKAIEAYEGLVRRSDDPEERIATQLTLGRLHLFGKDNTTKALAIYKDILGARPDHAEATARLKEVLYRRESWEALVPVLEREVQRASDARAQADAIFELATVLSDRVKDLDAAWRWLRRGVEVKRDHPGLVAAMIDQLERRGDTAELLPLLSWHVSYLEAKRRFQELAPQALRLARLHEARRDADKAYSAYQVASTADSRNVVVQLGLGRTAFETGRLDKALQTLQALLLVQHELEDSAARLELFVLLAKVCVEAGDKAKAKRHVARLLQLDPAHAEGLALQKKLG